MNSASPARHLLLLWFLTVCPGMAYVQALQVRNIIAEWLMAMALSFVLVSAVAMVMVFAEWRPEQGLNVVAGLTLLGVALSIVRAWPVRSRAK